MKEASSGAVNGWTDTGLCGYVPNDDLVGMGTGHVWSTLMEISEHLTKEVASIKFPGNCFYIVVFNILNFTYLITKSVGQFLCLLDIWVGTFQEYLFTSLF